MISIIIATYNAEECIRECLNSILVQTYSKYEVVIIDGKSQDNTLSIIHEFEGRINNLIVLSESDKGLYDAWNKGLAIASGEWFTFIGADDIYASQDSLLIFSKEIINNEKPFYYGLIACNGPEGDITGYSGSDWLDPWSMKFNFYQIRLPFPIMTCIFNREFISAEKFNLEYRVVADADLVLRCLKKWKGVSPAFIKNQQPLIRMGYGGISTNPKTHVLTLKEIYLIRKRNDISNINFHLFIRTWKVFSLNVIAKIFGEGACMYLIKSHHKLKVLLKN